MKSCFLWPIIFRFSGFSVFIFILFLLLLCFCVSNLSSGSFSYPMVIRRTMECVFYIHPFDLSTFVSRRQPLTSDQIYGTSLISGEQMRKNIKWCRLSATVRIQRSLWRCISQKDSEIHPTSKVTDWLSKHIPNNVLLEILWTHRQTDRKTRNVMCFGFHETSVRCVIRYSIVLSLSSVS